MSGPNRFQRCESSKENEIMAVQDDYILRTIRNLATAIGRLALGRDEVDYILPADESQDDLVARCV